MSRPWSIAFAMRAWFTSAQTDAQQASGAHGLLEKQVGTLVAAHKIIVFEPRMLLIGNLKLKPRELVVHAARSFASPSYKQGLRHVFAARLAEAQPKCSLPCFVARRDTLQAPRIFTGKRSLWPSGDGM